MMTIARPIPLPQPRRSRAMALSAMVHGALMVAWIYVPAPDLHQLGIGAMTVQLVLEQPQPEPPAAMPEPQPEPKPDPKPQPAPVPPKPVPPAKPMKAKPAPVVMPTAPAAESELSASTAPAATQPVMSDTPPPVAQSATTGGATALGSPNARNVEQDDYLRIVWSRIMRYRPARVPVAGTTRLHFTLDAGGELVSVDVAEGSGNATLDRAALDAVRRAAPFPPPPPSSSPVQHFEIPFQFRPAA